MTRGLGPATTPVLYSQTSSRPKTTRVGAPDPSDKVGSGSIQRLYQDCTPGWYGLDNPEPGPRALLLPGIPSVSAVAVVTLLQPAVVGSAPPATLVVTYMASRMVPSGVLGPTGGQTWVAASRPSDPVQPSSAPELWTRAYTTSCFWPTPRAMPSAVRPPLLLCVKPP